MRCKQYPTIAATQIQDVTAGLMAGELGLKGRGYKCTQAVLISVLLFAAVRCRSIEDACLRLRNSPTGDTIFNALFGWLTSHETLERRINAALSAQLPKGMLKKRQKLAIDITEIPYHGKPHREEREVRRGKPKKGTTHFHCYASVYVIRAGERFTLAMTYVWKGESLRDVVRRLMQQVAKLGIRVKFVLLDREFYNLDVVRYLKRARYPFLMPVVRRGRRPKVLKTAKGVWKFWSGNRSGWSHHQLENKNRRENVDICISVENYRDEKGKSRRRKLVFASWRITHQAAKWVRELYRRRFAIESSYRQMHEARIRTCTRNPQLRMLFAAIGLLLRNVWVWIHRNLLATWTGGRLEIHLEALRLSTLLLQLQRCAQAHLGCADPTPDLNQTLNTSKD